jgi:hypothetical protein
MMMKKMRMKDTAKDWGLGREKKKIAIRGSTIMIMKGLAMQRYATKCS